MKTVRDTVYYSTGNIIYLGAQWIISVILVRIGGLEDAGYFSLAMTVANIFGMLANYGLRTYQVSDISGRFSDAVYIVSRLITVALSVVFCLVYSLIYGYDKQILLVIMLFMLHKAVETFSDVLNGIWQKNGDMLSIGFSMGIKGILNFIGFIAVYIYSHSLVVSMAVMAVFSLLVLAVYDLPKSKNWVSFIGLFRKSDFEQIKALLKTGFLTMLFVVLLSAFSGIPKLVIERELDASLLGVFSSISAPTVLISTFAIGVLLPVAPKMADYFGRQKSKELFRILLLSCGVFAAVGILAYIAAVFVGRELFDLVFGSEVASYFNLFYYMIAISVFSAIISCFSTYFISARKLKALLAFSALTCMLVLLLSVTLVHYRGMFGAAYAMLTALIVQIIAEGTYILRDLLKMKKNRLNSAVITGATGAVGVALINKLIEEKISVTVVLNPDSKRNSNIPDSLLVTKIECDISDYSSLPEKIGHPAEVFFHLAWRGTTGKDRNNISLQSENVQYALDAVRAAKKLSCKVFVGVGSQAEYGRVKCPLSSHTPANPENEYGKAKLLSGIRTRELCRELKIRHEWVRLLSVYGPYDSDYSPIITAIKKLSNGERPKYTKGEQIWDYLYSGDAANALFLVARRGIDGKIYVLGSGTGRRLSEYFTTIHKVVNPDIAPFFGEVPYSDKQIMYLVADIEELKKDTGFEPEVPFEEGIRRTVEMTV